MKTVIMAMTATYVIDHERRLLNFENGIGIKKLLKDLSTLEFSLFSTT